ncbi:hypothetical protein DH2020_000698 [Rehmannia glutinosa]|uniref:Uncharacterized protein n=1 Tax=Rehmannia glutinosa TaxID=99300 RepID=A0ABR0XXC7_REHGL
MTIMASINTEAVALKSIRTKSSEERLSSRRRLSRDRPIIIDTSLDGIYYRESSVGIPFLWESQPGTPKLVRSMESPHVVLPPLTPPPSFHSTPISRNPSIKHPKTNLVPIVLLPKLNFKKKTQFIHQSSSRSSTSSSSSSPWSSSSSSPFGTPNESKQGRVLSPSRLSSDSRIEEDEIFESPHVSTWCFCSSTDGMSRGCYASIIKLLLGEF